MLYYFCYHLFREGGRKRYMDKFVTIQLNEDDSFLNLGSFYNRYSGNFFYYQQCETLGTLEFSDFNNKSTFVFHLNKKDCIEVDDRGNLLPILMCHISKKGLALPNEILSEIRRNGNTVYLYSIGYADFALSTSPPKATTDETGKDSLLRLFGIEQ